MALLSDVFPQCQEADGPRGVFIKAEQRKPVEVPRRDEQRDNSQSGCSVEPRAPCQGSCGMAQLYELLHQCQEVDGPQPVVTVSVPELQQRSAHQQSAQQQRPAVRLMIRPPESPPVQQAPRAQRSLGHPPMSPRWRCLRRQRSAAWCLRAIVAQYQRRPVLSGASQYMMVVLLRRFWGHEVGPEAYQTRNAVRQFLAVQLGGWCKRVQGHTFWSFCRMVSCTSLLSFQEMLRRRSNMPRTRA